LNLITDQTNPTKGLTRTQAEIFLELKEKLDRTLNSSPPCPGDGNVDGVVDQTDVQNWTHFFQIGGGSSWYDFPVFDPALGMAVYDGMTNQQDLQVIQSNFGRKCQPR
jgi:hypothetical protein